MRTTAAMTRTKVFTTATLRSPAARKCLNISAPTRHKRSESEPNPRRRVKSCSADAGLHFRIPADRRRRSRLGTECYLSINFMPNGLAASPQTLDNTLAAAEGCGFPIDRIILEVTEGEMIQDMRRFATMIARCRLRGMRVAVDDFGAG